MFFYSYSSIVQRNQSLSNDTKITPNQTLFTRSNSRSFIKLVFDLMFDFLNNAWLRWSECHLIENLLYYKYCIHADPIIAWWRIPKKYVNLRWRKIGTFCTFDLLNDLRSAWKAVGACLSLSSTKSGRGYFPVTYLLQMLLAKNSKNHFSPHFKVIFPIFPVVGSRKF